jgi:hypothetical protein
MVAARSLRRDHNHAALWLFASRLGRNAVHLLKLNVNPAAL